MDTFKTNIREFPSQLTPRGITIKNAGQLRATRPDGLVISGMGGSGLAGMILEAAAIELGLRVPIVIWKDYGLPNPQRLPLERPLYFFVSFSGNTEEVLSGLALLKRRRGLSRAAAITTGGALHVFAERENIPVAVFPAGNLTPRQSIGRMFYGITELAKHAGLIKKPLSPQNKSLPSTLESRGHALARELRGSLPILYSASAHAHLGYIWKITLNETAKQFAFHNVIPEMNHNELVGFEIPREVRALGAAALFLENPSSSPRLMKRFARTKQLIKRAGAKTISVSLAGKTMLEKTWTTIVLAEWTAYYLARMNRRDPQETDIIQKLKEAMKQSSLR